MRIPVYTRQFERDIKQVRKRGKNLEKFKIIARALIGGKSSIHFIETTSLSGAMQDAENVTSRQIGFSFISWRRIGLYSKERGRIPTFLKANKQPHKMQ